MEIIQNNLENMLYLLLPKFIELLEVHPPVSKNKYHRTSFIFVYLV